MSARILKRVSQIGRQNFAKISDLGLSTQTLKMVKMNPKLLVTRMEEEIPTPAIEMLQKHFEIAFWNKPGPIERGSLLSLIQDKDALFCLLTDKIDKEVLEKASNLKVLGTMSVGFDHLDLETLKAKGVQVGYTPDVLTDATAELTVALLLATSRRLFEAADQLRNGGWGSWTPLWMCGPSLLRATVGIVGLGRIGQGVHQRLKPFGVSKFLYTGRERKSADIEDGAEHVPLDKLLSQSDFVIVTCSLTPETANLFNTETFGMMKKSAIFINTSRGGLVNQEDLLEALTSGVISAAGLDVMVPEPLPIDHPLTKLPNCVLIPHIGSATVDTRTRMATLTAENLIAGINGQKMPEQLVESNLSTNQ